MPAMPREGGNALVVAGPRPGMEWPTIPFSCLPAPVPNGKRRTSSLESPIMLLTGHQSAIYTTKFNPAGTVIASGSHDRDIFLWNTHGDCKNFMVLRGHKKAVLDLQWTVDGEPGSIGEHRCVKIFSGHQHNFEKNLLRCSWARDGSKVTAGSSDRMVYVWDTTSRRILYKLLGHNGSVNETVFHPSEPIIGSCSSDKQIYLGEI